MEAYGKKPLWQWILLYVIIGGLVYAGIYYFYFSKKGYSYNSNQTQNTVALTASGFVPQAITIKAGTTVYWTNTSGKMGTINSAPHPVHTDYPALNLGNFASGGKLMLTFDKPGTYKYHNHLNPSQYGSVTVQ